MGESAVLFHSYSFAAPLSRNDSDEENPIHALSQSVSFGRFMTENLEWGKWSSFSHKKYVDEAEKFSQPGSVAQKKAFFEAHYKRIAEAKKAASNESSDPKQEPENVDVLLNTLETLTKDEEVKEEESLVLSIGKDEEPEITSVVVLEQEEEPPMVVEDDFKAVHDELEETEKHTEDGELLKKSSSVGGEEEEEEEERRSATNNSSLSGLSMEKSAVLETPDKATELAFSQNIISESPVVTTHSSVKQNEKTVRQRFSFLNFLMGNTKTKTQDQNLTRNKRKTDKKQFLCLCFKPQMDGETEAEGRACK